MIINGLSKPFSYDDFMPNAPAVETRYGLPAEVKFCKRCTISNQRPNSAVEFTNNIHAKKHTIHFDEDGICDACRVAENKWQHIDWNTRERELKELCDRFRGDGSYYDCLVPGSGGKDSVYAAHILKYKYGMHPLTVTWAPHIYTEWGRKNHQAWIHSGFDNILVTPNGRVHRILTRLSVENIFHPFQPFILGQKSLAPRLATMWNIPLVVYGENEAEYGNPLVDTNSAKRDWSYFTSSDRTKIFLGGQSYESLIKDFGISPVDLQCYFPTDPEQIAAKKIEVHYLGYYLKWHPQSCYYYAVENAGFIPSPERTPGTYSKYNSIDDRIDDFHYYTTYIKFGIGRATYDSAQEIRSGDITREEGVALIKKYDGEFPERFASEIFDYLSIPEKEFGQASTCFKQPIMTRDYFMALCDRFRSPHLWQWNNGKWQLRHTVYA